MSRRVHSFALSASLMVIAAAWGLTGCGGGGGGGEGSAGATPAASTPSSGAGGGGGSAVGTSNQPPGVSVSTGDDAVAFLPVHFSTATTLDAGVTITASNFNYGDGQTGTSPTHTYDKPGAYTVIYTVTDSKARQGQGKTQVTVKACSMPAMAAATVSADTIHVCVQTNKGEMVFALDSAKAPISTSNFMRYVNDGYYNSTVVHRVQNASPDFWVVQAGQVGVNTDGYFIKTPVNKYDPIELESNNGLLNKRYTLGMARTSVPKSATSQFYINLMDTPVFDYAPGLRDGYAVFGKIVYGTAVADAMGAASTVNAGGGFAYFPQQELKILGMAAK
ncbi:MAG: hypothetical protein RI907_3381 [Pseudomonadota bacterium]|jgi:cyclophilin family peptidyl-prolyl cis-trans isomerase